MEGTLVSHGCGRSYPIRGGVPRFVRNFLSGADGIEGALRAYVAAVKDRSFPDPAQHCY